MRKKDKKTVFANNRIFPVKTKRKAKRRKLNDLGRKQAKVAPGKKRDAKKTLKRGKRPGEELALAHGERERARERERERERD